MKVSVNWLREFVELPPTVEALCDLLTMAGVEVEGVETRGAAFDKVVVAQILESAQHPNADRLSVCKVDDGSGQMRQIVCGAKNYKVGDKVPLALPGAVLPGDPSAGSGQVFKIRVGKLRGVDSEGMLCSAKELRLAEDAEGLLILPPETRVGAPIGELFPPDTILDLEITPNRPDLLSHGGLAREIAALTGKKCSVLSAQCSVGRADGWVTIDALEQCPFYSARRISNVRVAPSPNWLRQKLEAAGLRPINNVVDITNFVMLELGQPLHAFDADKLRGGIRVRAAREGEEFLALDGRTYKLTPGDCVIADAERAVAIAGVMGGEETGVTESTRNIVLEGAYFQPASIRRTGRRLGLSSDSSYRFERGVDPEMVLRASQRATDLISELANGEAAPAPATAGAAPDFRRTVSLRIERANALLGVDLPPLKIDSILTGFGLEQAGDAWRTPSFRQDLTREVDLIEEIARVVGIDSIPSRVTGKFAPVTASDRAHDRRMALRRQLVALGFYEARTLTLVGEQVTQYVPDVLRVRNPLTEDQVVLRPTLIGGLIETLANNVRGGTKNVRLFEVGRVFGAGQAGEQSRLALLMTGAVAPASWRDAKPRDADIFDLKGVLESLGIGALDFRPAKNPNLALAAEIFLGENKIGDAGQLWPARARELNVTAPVLVAEIDLSALEISEPATRAYREIAKYPAVTRDIAMIVPVQTPYAQVAQILQSADEPLLESVELFDVFTDPSGQRISADKKSLAFSLTYRAKSRTLTVDEANAAHARLKDRLKAGLDVTFRE
jgi:phenylalanyl-tRNA synthetase beta chain